MMNHARLPRGRTTSALTALAALVFILTPTLVVGRAVADHGDWGAIQLMSNPDNVDHDYRRIYLQDGGGIACNHGADQLDRTDLRLNLGTGDVECRDGFFDDPDWFGLTTCERMVGTTSRCDLYDVDFDNSDVDATPDTAEERDAYRYIGCHEFGHTGGLGHRPAEGDTDDNSCMRRATTLDQHDISEVNEDVCHGC